ncbi:unnamed protein product [Phytophthora fragariaefolia]|uniref:Unnamed protein product n=1 Tax=Phytophthora fragariaefolia TaxID=1490495 RepID=A0A9W6YAN0_9STRA|nr:unnamed protein product [Phytophthora fragariaefolia]
MQTRGRHQQKKRALGLVEEAKTLLLALGCILNQRHLNHGPSQQTQRALRRKNELVARLEDFISEQQSSGDNDAQGDLQATVERLQKQLNDQRAAFEQERAQLQQQATITHNAQTELSSSLNKVLPQLRGLLDAYERERGDHVSLTHEAIAETTTRTVTLTQTSTSSQDLGQKLTQLQAAFDTERAQLVEQVSKAENAQRDISRSNLMEREAVLTCPISLDLFEDPVMTECCGKTFSSEALTQALTQNSQCPVCRSRTVAIHVNRDMANLVELHRIERSVLGMSNNGAARSTIAKPDGGRLVAERRLTEQTESSSQGRFLMTSTVRESQHRNHRNQRVQARSAVPHRQFTQSIASPTSTPPPSIRGRRWGRSSYSRHRRSSRSSSSVATASNSDVDSRASAAPNATRSTSLSTAVQSPSSGQSWRSNNIASQTSTTSVAARSAGNRTNYSYIPIWGVPTTHPRNIGTSSYRVASSTPTYATQSNSSIQYGRAPTNGELNIHPYASIRNYTSSSDSDY